MDGEKDARQALHSLYKASLCIPTPCSAPVSPLSLLHGIDFFLASRVSGNDAS